MKIFNAFSLLIKSDAPEPEPAPDVSRILARVGITSGGHAELAANNSQSDPYATEERAPLCEEERARRWMDEGLVKLELSWRQAQKADFAPEKMSQVVKKAQNLYSIAEPCGFPIVSRLTKCLCQLFEATNALGDPDLVRLHIDACRAAFSYRRDHDEIDPAAESVCQALELRVRQIAASKGVLC